MLLKIFIPLTIVIIPILIPINVVGGKGPSFATGDFAHGQWSNVTGLNTLGFGNIRPDNNNRYWAHLVLAIFVIVFCCFVFFDELRTYIRLRQMYLTSPQHRLRASATTVLVTGIPKKWCTVEALEGLYDVFPGGIRNIWVNRDYTPLHDKVKERDSLARTLEQAETNLIKNAVAKDKKQKTKAAKRAGQKMTKKDEQARRKAEDEDGAAMAADTAGLDEGDPHQTRHNLDDALYEPDDVEKQRPAIPIPVVGHGIEAVGRGFQNLGRTVFGGVRKVGTDLDRALQNDGGFVADTSEDTYGLVTDSSQSAYQTRPELANSSTQSPGYTAAEERPAWMNRKSKALQPGTPAPNAYNSEVDARINQTNGDSEKQQPSTSKGPTFSEKIKKYVFWRPGGRDVFNIPSPEPHGYDEATEFPINSPLANITGVVKGVAKIPNYDTQYEEPEYNQAYDDEWKPEDDRDAVWTRYIELKDRETMRLPIFGWKWMITLPFVGKKVDTIYYCRQEVARLNVEIEEDQKHADQFPVMNSAFIQFNHQVAAHMACQAVSHHIPNQMSPRLVEISPDDVIWDNMSVKWWERYVRSAIVITLLAGLIILWAFPVAFTGALSQISSLAQTYPWLGFLTRLPAVAISIIQGILPAILLSILMALLPIILRMLATFTGISTGMAVELAVQDYYFAFSFVQIFLVVTLSSGITKVITELSGNPQGITTILATNLPAASNYFFSYLLLQALSVSSGALVQIFPLISWFILAPIFDSTARQKWSRQITLQTVQWGTFFPVYTNLAAIGLIYSVISPLILVFNIVTFGLFWFVYRYTTLYVNKFRFDTGGLLFPKAINQLFTGLYIMELCLIGLFFLVQDITFDSSGIAHPGTSVPCKVQGIIMIVVLILTALFQILLNWAFSPLFQYLPITLEDDAVERDEAFARAMEQKWAGEEAADAKNQHMDGAVQSTEYSRNEASIELQEIDEPNSTHNKRNFLSPVRAIAGAPMALGKGVGNLARRGAWASRDRSTSRRGRSIDASRTTEIDHSALTARRHRLRASKHDAEAQKAHQKGALGDALFRGLSDEIEDLTPDERDKLVRRAFQHSALRAKRPVIWIPRDRLGVSDDEVRRSKGFAGGNLWVSNVGTGLDGKGRVVFRRSPPDFDEVDLIEL
jgi:hypothetical protein